jgi:hypothetical protein
MVGILTHAILPKGGMVSANQQNHQNGPMQHLVCDCAHAGQVWNEQSFFFGVCFAIRSCILKDVKISLQSTVRH